MKAANQKVGSSDVAGGGQFGTATKMEHGQKSKGLLHKLGDRRPEEKKVMGDDDLRRCRSPPELLWCSQRMES